MTWADVAITPLFTVCALGAVLLVWRGVVDFRRWRAIRRSDRALVEHTGEVMARNGVTNWKVGR